MINENDYPRLRRTLAGDSAIEYLDVDKEPHLFDLHYLVGLHPHKHKDDLLGAIHSSCGIVITRHSYFVLADLLYPVIDEGEFYG